ncbi:anthrax toxin receptor 1-like [Tamandua tetradactyla]|uniref:anthrax toxin receptor 1-like n=1 Tax=Tamandua tetradactyla TaxID=48850 RepID=UPI004053966A
MGSCAPPAPFWLLLLLLPLQLPGTEGRPQGLLGRGQSGLKEAEKETCNSIFDLYFILDIPKLRMSFILYSTDGFTLMPLTPDRKEIERGLKDLQAIIPEGSTFMQEGFKKANEQIEKEIREGKKVSSMIIAFTDGTLEPKPYEETKFEVSSVHGYVCFPAHVLVHYT